MKLHAFDAAELFKLFFDPNLATKRCQNNNLLLLKTLAQNTTKTKTQMKIKMHMSYKKAQKDF